MAPLMLTLSKDGAFMVDGWGKVTKINDESWGSATGVLKCDEKSVLITHPQGCFNLDITKDVFGNDIEKEGIEYLKQVAEDAQKEAEKDVKQAQEQLEEAKTAAREAADQANQQMGGEAGAFKETSVVNGQEAYVPESSADNAAKCIGRWQYTVEGYGKFEYEITYGDSGVTFMEPKGTGFNTGELSFDGEFWTGEIKTQDGTSTGFLRLKYDLGGKIKSNFKTKEDGEWQQDSFANVIGGNPSTKLSKEKWSLNGPMVRPENDPDGIVAFHQSGVWRINIKTGVSKKLPSGALWEFVSGAVYVPADSGLFVAGKAVLFHPTGMYGVDLTSGKETQLAKGNWGGVRGATYDASSKKAIVWTVLGQFRVDLIHGSLENINVVGKKDEGWGDTPGSVAIRNMAGVEVAGLPQEYLLINQGNIVKVSVTPDVGQAAKKAMGYASAQNSAALKASMQYFLHDPSLKGSFNNVRCVCSLQEKAFCSLGGRNYRNQAMKKNWGK